MTSYVKAGQFENPTDISRFDGTINYKGTEFEYIFFITPITRGTPDYEWIVENITRRRQKGEPRKACLGTTKKFIEHYLDEELTSAYGFVRQVGYEDEASGAIQIYDWSKKPKQENQPQSWITDLCRHYDSRVIRSRISPVKVLLYLFEQMVMNQLKQPHIYLMVENRNEDVLVPIYENYGFRRIEDDNLSDPKSIYMKKKIRRDHRYADFPFGGVEEGPSPTVSISRSKFTRSRRESRKSGNTRSRRG
jgi:hypothetical protein